MNIFVNAVLVGLVQHIFHCGGIVGKIGQICLSHLCENLGFMRFKMAGHMISVHFSVHFSAKKYQHFHVCTSLLIS